MIEKTSKIVQLKNVDEIGNFFAAFSDCEPYKIDIALCTNQYSERVNSGDVDMYAIPNVGFICINRAKDNLISPIHIFRESDKHRGWGTIMIKYVQHKYDKLTLHVWLKNIPALNLYEKMGFKKTADRADDHMEMTWTKTNFSELTKRLKGVIN